MKKSKFSKYFEPDKNFVQKTKRVFLSTFLTKYAKPRIELKPVYAFRYFFRGAVVGVAIMVVIGTTSTYAYQKDVSPENILYPLKLSQENIRAYLTPETKKSEFHLVLAEKRLKEIQGLAAKNIDGQKTERLTENLRKEVKKSLRIAKEGNLPQNFKKAVETESKKNTEDSIQLLKKVKMPTELEESEIEIEFDDDDKVETGNESEISDEPRLIQIRETASSGTTQFKRLKTNVTEQQDSQKKSEDRKGKSIEFCEKLGRLINNELLEIKLKLSDDQEIIERFKDKCED